MKDGKAPLEYLITSVDDGDAWVLKGGADNYGVRNWLIDKILGSTYEAAIKRHYNAWIKGQDLDPDSGYHHFHHIRACCAIVLDAIKHDQLIDDRDRKESIDQNQKDDYPWIHDASRAPEPPKMTMDDAHDLLDALETSDCVIREPRDAGTQLPKCVECGVKFVPSEPEQICCDTLCDRNHKGLLYTRRPHQAR